MKKRITDTIFHKINYHSPIKVSDINIDLHPDDIIFAGFEESEYRSDGGMDAHYFMEIKRERDETEIEYNERLIKEEKQRQYMKEQRFKQYLKLKSEFEDGK